MTSKTIDPSLRREYLSGELLDNQTEKDPFILFDNWFKEACEAKVDLPDSMVLATSTKEGHGDARIVLLKNIDSKGFYFFTHYESQKGKQLETNPFATALFWWSALEKQVRISGKVTKTSASISDEYFKKRPKESQIGATVSLQSKSIPNRLWLEKRYEEADLRLQNKPVLRPNNWGGYCLCPTVFEFWQGRENRLHDRIRYTKEEDKGWSQSRLAP